MQPRRPAGFWVLQGVGLFLCVMLLAGQTLSLVDYDLTVAMGLQEPAGQITEVGVAFNLGFAAGDTIVYLPLLVAGLAGLWLGRPWGAVALAAALGITAYWPVVGLFMLFFAEGAPGFAFPYLAAYVAGLVPVAVFGLWGLWYLARHRGQLVSGPL